MMLFRIFGIGSQRILAKNCSASGTVTAVENSSLHVIKKPVRLYPNEANTLYSHYICFRYTVDAISYIGKVFIDVNLQCPRKGDIIKV